MLTRRRRRRLRGDSRPGFVRASSGPYGTPPSSASVPPATPEMVEVPIHYRPQPQRARRMPSFATASHASTVDSGGSSLFGMMFGRGRSSQLDLQGPTSPTSIDSAGNSFVKISGRKLERWQDPEQASIHSLSGRVYPVGEDGFAPAPAPAPARPSTDSDDIVPSRRSSIGSSPFHYVINPREPPRTG
ncbi:uncharacterized protein V1510DRAFT_422601 [Dipodascopsis tothii]|uniref:uncharacterized protein n=1 Tax=Dipodascopsis tothii TaxID=44089 RepID=UPI0034CFE22B